MSRGRKPRSASRGRLPSEELFEPITPSRTERRVTRSATEATEKTVTAPNGGHGTCLNWATVSGCVILGMITFFILERIPYEVKTHFFNLHDFISCYQKSMNPNSFFCFPQTLYEVFFEALQSLRILPRVRCPEWPECQKCVDSCVAPS